MNYKNECTLQEFVSIKVGSLVIPFYIIPGETDNTSTLKPSIFETKEHFNFLYNLISIKSVKKPFKVSQCYLLQSNQSDAVLPST